MIYKSTSVKEVIGKFLRNTRITDSSYIDDLFAWIPEAMGMLRTRYELKPFYKDLIIEDHCAKLPCGLICLDAVLYNGARLREGSSQAHVRKLPNYLKSSDATANYIYKPDTDVLVENHMSDRVNGAELKALTINGNSAFYKIQMDYIQTSFEKGEITIYYMAMPLDCDGYPLIPDEENYKEALYWYMLMKAIEAGYEHHLFDWKHCWIMWEEKYLPRAIAKMKTPSVDRMERIRQSSVRLVPPQHFWTDFFTNAEQYQGINGL